VLYHPNQSIPNIHTEILTVLSTTGVYIYLKDNTPIYIGKAVNIRARLLSHEQNATLDAKDAQIIRLADTIDIVYIESEFRALVFEAELISRLKPKYNVRWRDDKSYLYIKITIKEQLPKILLVRKEDDHKSKYFGPFDSTRNAESLLQHIRKIIPYCSQIGLHKAPCFYSKIGLCDPCPNVIQKMTGDKQIEEIKRYKKHIKTIIRIFEGKTELVFRSLKKEIDLLASHKEYEQAIKIRQAMKQLELLIHHMVIPSVDIYSFNRSEQSIQALLVILRRFFPMLESLHRIECYDNSTLNFQDSTASMIVFSDGMVNKSEYRKFRIKADLDNDFDMLKEVISRRANNVKWPKPDLIIIDGGKPQIQAVIKVLSPKCLVPSDDREESIDLGIMDSALGTVHIIGIAKNPDRLIIGVEGYPTVKPDRHDLGFRLVQNMRDEAHRFAKKYHTHLRTKAKMVQ